MKSKESKAMLDTWAAKEKLYEEVKNLPEDEVLKYIKKKTEKVLKSLKLKAVRKIKAA